MHYFTQAEQFQQLSSWNVQIFSQSWMVGQLLYAKNRLCVFLNWKFTNKSDKLVENMW